MKLALVFCLFLVGRLPAAYHWKNVPIPGGGFVSGIVFSAIEKDLVYARTDVGGAYRWEAASSSWIPLTDTFGPEGDSNATGVLSIGLDSSDTNRVYLACGLYTNPVWWKWNAFVLCSKDRGKTWSKSPLPFKLGGNEDGRGAGERLQVDPGNSARLFLGTTQDGLWLSEDHGATWKRVKGMPADKITFVAFDKSKAGKVIYAGALGKGAGLWRSQDSGISWARLPGQPEGLLAYRCAFSGTRLIVTFDDREGPNGINHGEVWALDTAKESWEKLAMPAGAGGFAGVSIDAAHPDTILVSSLDRWHEKDDIFRSVDSGKSWKGLLKKSKWDFSVAPFVKSMNVHWTGLVEIDPFDSGHAIFVTGYGIWATRNLLQADKGKAVTWGFENRGLEETVPLSLVSPPSGPHLFSAVGDIDGFRHDSLDEAAQTRLRPEMGTNREIAFAALKPEMMIRTHEKGKLNWVMLSNDAGLSWTPFKTAPPGTKGSGHVAISADASSLFWSPDGAGMHRSTDGSQSWTASSGLPEGLAPVADFVNPAKVYAVDTKNHQLYVSMDAGASFKRGSDQMPVQGKDDFGILQAVPGKEGELWLGHSKGLFYSADGGKSLKKIKAVTEVRRMGFGMTAPGGNYPAIYLAGKLAGNYGMYRSDDMAKSWVRINDDQHQYGWLNAIIGDPRIYGRVYIATGGRGILYGDF